MPQCPKCSSENTEIRTGSYKTKPGTWRGIKCKDCTEMTFEKTGGGNGGGQQPQSAALIAARAQLPMQESQLLAEAKRTNELLVKLISKISPGGTALEPEELKPDDD